MVQRGAVLKDLASYGYLVGQVHVEPLDLSVIHLAKLIVEAAAEVDAKRVGVSGNQPARRVGKHDGARHHALVREERIVFAHVYSQRVDDLLRLLIADAWVGPRRLACTDR